MVIQLEAKLVNKLKLVNKPENEDEITLTQIEKETLGLISKYYHHIN